MDRVAAALGLPSGGAAVAGAVASAGPRVVNIGSGLGGPARYDVHFVCTIFIIQFVCYLKVTVLVRPSRYDVYFVWFVLLVGGGMEWNWRSGAEWSGWGVRERVRVGLVL